jgi:hypothetical protein
MTEIAWGITVELGCLSPYNSLLCVYIVMMSLTGVVFEDSDKLVLMATRERERERECVCVFQLVTATEHTCQNKCTCGLAKQ